MAQTPTSKAQVQAYRFVLKRMESALVRKDAVMLHDPMRTHLRAATVGVIIAVLAAAGFFVFGLIRPKSALDADGIVVGKQSHSMYVFVTTPERRLIPVTNLASARLILLAVSSAGGSQASPNSGAAEPRYVDDKALANVTRTSMAGIPGAPLDIPNEKEKVPPKWSLCDTTILDETLPDSTKFDRPDITTTALIGLDRTGRQLGEDAALLFLSKEDTKYYLVYDGKRAMVDLDDPDKGPKVQLALNLAIEQAERRVASNVLLNAIPEVPELVAPRIPSRGATPNYEIGNELVGSVVREERAETTNFWVVLSSGIQLVPRSMANLIRSNNSDDVDIPGVRPDVIARAPRAPDADQIKIDDFPRDVPRVLPIRESTVACLHWEFDKNQGDHGKQLTSITVADRLAQEGGAKPVELAQADGNGPRVDAVLLPAGKGAAVQGVVSAGQRLGTGTIWLVTDQGVKYGVPDVEVAKALGLGDRFDPAPEAILKGLPTGPALDPDEAVRTFDKIDIGDQGSRLPQPGG